MQGFERYPSERPLRREGWKEGCTLPKIRIEPVEISSVLPSHGLHRSTIDDEGLNFRVRNGTGCTSLSMATELNGLYSVLKCCTLKAA